MHEVNINLSLNYFILFVKSAESQYVTTLYEMVFSDDQSFIVMPWLEAIIQKYLTIWNISESCVILSKIMSYTW